MSPAHEDRRDAAPTLTSCLSAALPTLVTAFRPSPPNVRIAFPEPGELRARKLISRAAVRPTTKYPSVRLDRMVHCESEVEVEIAELLDACPAVKRFGEQPAIVHYRTRSGVHRHMPDFLIETTDSKVFIEAKFAKDIDEAVLERTRLLKVLLAEVGYEYHLVTERHTRAGAYLANARYLLRRGRGPANVLVELQVLARLRTEESCALGTFDPTELQCVARLVLEARVFVAMDRFIDAASLVTIRQSQGGMPWALALFK